MYKILAPTAPTVRNAMLGALLLAAPLAACSAPYDKVAATASIPEDYHQRHPIALANAPRRLDVFLVGAGKRLDERQANDVRGFAADFKASGQGPLSVMVPILDNQRAVQATFNQVREVLAKSGIRGSMLVARYSVADPTLAAPVQLSFLKLQAKEASVCGQWPEDLASGSSVETWQNKPYYNFGCATQKDFAMQIADPRDLVRPRVEDPSDVQMRIRAIGNIRGTVTRTGIDPGTNWNNYNTSISGVGGTN